MALNKEEHYGFCVGGVLAGCLTQDGRFYRPDGSEVDVSGQPVKAAPAPAAKAAPKAAPKSEAEEQVAAQLKG